MLNDISLILSAITAITAIIAAIVAVITLVYLARQTNHLAEQTKYLGNQIEQNTSISTSLYYQNVNAQFLQHPDESILLVGETKEDALASIIVGALQLSFELEKEQVKYNPLSKKYFEANVIYAMRQEPMHSHWEQNKHLYEIEFVEYIDQLLQEQDHEKQSSLQIPQR